MRKKIVGILVCTLLIGAGTIAIADWSPGDGHKMHFPQLPDPDGFDVDFGYWEMGDDWQCSETGTVDDIHFWISWFQDDPLDIPWIKCSIWTNEPNGPGGYSIPKDLKWEGTFLPGQFIIAGPWDGQQRWFMPWGEVISEYHYLYWQVNIPEIDAPFEQQEGEIYWLIIDMPFDVEFLVGWKNTKDYFMDHAVWRLPGEEWMMIDGIDFAFVITGKTCTNPSIDIEKYVWDEENMDWIDADTMSEAIDIPICNDVKFLITVHNDGDCPLYNINISDHMHDSLKFNISDPKPKDVWHNASASEWQMYWIFPGPLMPGETININITAHVDGPDCSNDYNKAHVGANTNDGTYTEDEDSCWIHAYKKSRDTNRPFLEILQTHPNIFPLLRLILMWFGL